MKVDEVIHSVVRELKGEDYSMGALLHGSFAVGRQHPESDVDILCVTNTDWLSKEIRQIEGMEVEIQRIPEPKVRRDLTHRLPTKARHTKAAGGTAGGTVINSTFHRNPRTT